MKDTLLKNKKTSAYGPLVVKLKKKNGVIIHGQFKTGTEIGHGRQVGVLSDG